MLLLMHPKTIFTFCRDASCCRLILSLWSATTSKTFSVVLPYCQVSPTLYFWLFFPWCKQLSFVSIYFILLALAQSVIDHLNCTSVLSLDAMGSFYFIYLGLGCQVKFNCFDALPSNLLMYHEGEDKLGNRSMRHQVMISKWKHFYGQLKYYFQMKENFWLPKSFGEILSCHPGKFYCICPPPLSLPLADSWDLVPRQYSLPHTCTLVPPIPPPHPQGRSVQRTDWGSVQTPALSCHCPTAQPSPLPNAAPCPSKAP